MKISNFSSAIFPDTLERLRELSAFGRQRSSQHQMEHDLRKELAAKAPDKDKILSLLNEHHVDPEAVSAKHGNAALHALARSRKLSASEIEATVENFEAARSLDFNKKNNKGDTPLHIAAREQTEACSLLFQKKPDVTQVNQDGESVLSIAKQQYLEARKTALFSYSKEQLNDANSPRATIKEYLKAKDIFRQAQRALFIPPATATHKGKERERTVRFADEVQGTLSAERPRSIPLKKRLEDAQQIIEKQRRHIAQLEAAVEALERFQRE